MRRADRTVMAAWMAVGTALAQGGDAARAQPVEQQVEERRPASGIGMAVEVGGGVQDFARGQLADVTTTGGAWAVRLLIGTRWYLGGEVAYVGSANPMSFAGIDTSAKLIGSGLEGALRLQLPIAMSDVSLIKPYLLGGVGWHRYDLVSGSDVIDRLTPGTNGLAVPLGGGLLFVHRRLLFDLRGAYRLGFYNNPVRSDESSAGTDNWSVTAHVGVEF